MKNKNSRSKRRGKSKGPLNPMNEFLYTHVTKQIEKFRIIGNIHM